MATFVKLHTRQQQQQRNLSKFLEIIKADVCDKATLFCLSPCFLILQSLRESTIWDRHKVSCYFRFTDGRWLGQRAVSTVDGSRLKHESSILLGFNPPLLVVVVVRGLGESLSFFSFAYNCKITTYARHCSCTQHIQQHVPSFFGERRFPFHLDTKSSSMEGKLLMVLLLSSVFRKREKV